eukprot:Rhum_TRINITY_DN17599_c0_g2::Rhum_TRINITY_DN17599_c0_g2_i1::g.166108::m.166108
MRRALCAVARRHASRATVTSSDDEATSRLLLDLIPLSQRREAARSNRRFNRAGVCRLSQVERRDISAKLFQKTIALHESGCTVGPKSIGVAMRFFADSETVWWARKLCDWMADSGACVTAGEEKFFEVHLATLRCLVQKKKCIDDKFAEEHVRQMLFRFSMLQMPPVLVGTLAIYCFQIGGAMRSEGARLVKVLNGRKDGFRVSVKVYTSMIKGAPTVWEATRTMEMMKAEPERVAGHIDSFVYAAVLGVCLRCNDVISGERYFNEAIDKGMTGEALWSRYLALLCENNRVADALLLGQSAPVEHRGALRRRLDVLFEKNKDLAVFDAFSKELRASAW